MNWLKKHFVTLVIVLIFIVGLGLLIYPTFSDWWNSFHQSKIIMDYSETVAQMDKEDYDRILKSAKEYNKELAESGIKWAMSDKEKKEYIIFQFITFAFCLFHFYIFFKIIKI